MNVTAPETIPVDQSAGNVLHAALPPRLIALLIVVVPVAAERVISPAVIVSVLLLRLKLVVLLIVRELTVREPLRLMLVPEPNPVANVMSAVVGGGCCYPNC